MPKTLYVVTTHMYIASNASVTFSNFGKFKISFIFNRTTKNISVIMIAFGVQRARIGVLNMAIKVQTKHTERLDTLLLVERQPQKNLFFSIFTPPKIRLFILIRYCVNLCHQFHSALKNGQHREVVY